MRIKCTFSIVFDQSYRWPTQPHAWPRPRPPSAGAPLHACSSLLAPSVPVPTCTTVGLGFTLTLFVFLCSDQVKVKLPTFVFQKVHLICFKITQRWCGKAREGVDGTMSVHVDNR